MTHATPQATTSSRPRARTARAWLVLVALLMLTGVASAGRKRVVVLEFEGDRAEKFHADVVKLIKKSHTVVSIDKWNGTAEEMSATRLTEKNVKKVAKKLKVDGVVSGTVEKRRDEYILRMRLRSGVTGEVVGSQINIKSESSKLDSTAAKDVKEELIEVIANLDSNRAGGSDDEEEEEEKPKKVAKKVVEEEEEEEEEKPKRGGFVKKSATEDKPKKNAKKAAEEEEEEEEKPKKVAKKAAEEEEKPKKAAKKPAEEDKPKKVAKKVAEEEEEEKPKQVAAKPAEEEEEEKPKASKKKKVALAEEEGEEGELEGEMELPAVTGAAMYSPAERAVDAVVGLSFTGRRMSFNVDQAAVAQQPAGYKQYAPVPGAYLDATVYPLAIGHKRKDLLRGLGVTVMFDRVLVLNSKNPMNNMKLKSTEQRYAIGAVFRYPLGTAANAPVVGAALRYGRQQFSIEGMAQIPNVHYTLIDFTAFFNYTMSPKMVLNANAGLLLPTDAGAITKLNQYGRAKITGLEASVGLDYMLMKNIFARGELRLETLGYSFLGEGEKSTGVGGARDSYFGGVLGAGYLF